MASEIEVSERRFNYDAEYHHFVYLIGALLWHGFRKWDRRVQASVPDRFDAPPPVDGFVSRIREGLEDDFVADVRTKMEGRPMGEIKIPERCDERTEDPSTPSGWTRCMLDFGHDDLCLHVNAQRAVEWWPLDPDGSKLIRPTHGDVEEQTDGK